MRHHLSKAHQRCFRHGIRRPRVTRLVQGIVSISVNLALSYKTACAFYECLIRYTYTALKLIEGDEIYMWYYSCNRSTLYRVRSKSPKGLKNTRTIISH
jgi:hypothetical protein